MADNLNMRGEGSLQKTPLFDQHLLRGARLVPFAGWEMPVQYRGLREEHETVRSGVGLFDVSHMGEFRLKGPRALETLEWILSNHIGRLQAHEAQYNLMMNEKGGVVDDLIVYCIAPGHDYLLCVNAANEQKDWAWINQNNRGAELVNESSQWAQIAVQGPKSFLLLDRIFGSELRQLGSFKWLKKNYQNEELMIARTGYTGEAGVEIFIKNQLAVQLWEELLCKGEDLGVEPIGLGARDSLRTEMKYPLYGNDINDETTPYDARLGWAVKLQAKDFLGKERLLEQKQTGCAFQWVGFEVLDKAIARAGYRCFSFDTQEIGKVTSGIPSPSLKKNIGMAYLLKDLANEGTEFLIEIREKRYKARVVKTPFVTPASIE